MEKNDPAAISHCLSLFSSFFFYLFFVFIFVFLNFPHFHFLCIPFSVFSSFFPLLPPQPLSLLNLFTQNFLFRFRELLSPSFPVLLPPHKNCDAWCSWTRRCFLPLLLYAFCSQKKTSKKFFLKVVLLKTRNDHIWSQYRHVRAIFSY